MRSIYAHETRTWGCGLWVERSIPPDASLTVISTGGRNLIGVVDLVQPQIKSKESTHPL